ncbi:MAG: hypothetical protein KAQ89_07325 [Planctomycetes bacterium]|nr:hypothetical protein [Planctomycetota bacterium]
MSFNKKHILPLILIGCLLVRVFYEWGYVWWMELKELPVYMYDGYDLSLHLSYIAVTGILWINASYKILAFKSIAFIVFLDAVWTLGQFFMNGEYQGPLELLNALIFLPWLAWAYSRSYQLKSSPILPDRVYFISGKPKNTWSFYLSLFGEPTGSKGIYVNGRLYGYHKDVFVSRALDYERMNVLAVEIKSGTKLEEYLRTMIGNKYSMTNNCLILRLKVWWRLCQIKYHHY